ncbi:MAG: hypothetical protein LBU30_06340 [Candidatus Methanoplasma sp.]|jgi:Fe-S-cluster containining protein|nr:hypothetical protein [Candidatus Methanoplasma sp.]
MRYAIVSCIRCGRQRIIDRTAASSECPYCGASCEHKAVAVIFGDDDQRVVRDALARLHPFEIPEKKKRAVDSDPLSTLIHRYERCSDLQEKMKLVSRGLTDIYGTFTMEDLEKIDEKNAERMIGAMLELCLVHEVRHGIYRA